MPEILFVVFDNGQITSGQKTVKGPIASLACTTRGEIYEDNMSRVFLIAVDESAEQTQKIIDYQNCVAAGVINRDEEARVKQFIQNFVRLLQPCEVILVPTGYNKRILDNVRREAQAKGVRINIQHANE